MYIIIYYYYCYWDTHARKLRKALSRIASLQNRISSQASLSRKRQTTGSDSIHWWPSYQRPTRVGFYCEARYDHHPWRQCSLYSLCCQLDNGGGQEAVTHHPLDCLKGWWQSDHTYLILTDLMSLLQKVEWEAQTGYVTVSHPPSETLVSVLPRTCSPEMTDQIGCWQSNHHKWFVSQEIWSVEFETLYAGAMPRTSPHQSPGGERHVKRKLSMMFVKRTREGHCQSLSIRQTLDEEIYERQGGVYL